MEVLKVIGKIDPDGHLRLDLTTDLPEGKVDLILVFNSMPKHINREKYNFSDLSGKLLWRGDAVAIQKEMRNEW